MGSLIISEWGFIKSEIHLGVLKLLLKGVTIQNYRKFKNEAFSMADDVTLLAGANNSGKTSMINLIGSIMQNGKTPFFISDIPVRLSKQWVDEVYETFILCFKEGDDQLSTVERIINKLFSTELFNLECDLIIPATSIRFRIDYSEEDDIRKFADFIMDLNPIIKASILNIHFNLLMYPLDKHWRKIIKNYMQDIKKFIPQKIQH